MGLWCADSALTLWLSTDSGLNFTIGAGTLRLESQSEASYPLTLSLPRVGDYRLLDS